MIAWTLPAAFTGLILLAGPVLVHMLLRRNARRVVFPTTRFFEATHAAAVRFRRPSDLGLLLLRCGIVVAAVVAAAQPVWLASWRTARWNQRLARAVVLDTSRSVSARQDGARLADQEMDAFASARFDGADLRDGIARAAEWLVRAAPARREIVIVSDFQRGAIDRGVVDAVPSGVGLRFIRAASHPAQAAVPLPPIAGWRGSVWQPSAMLRGDAVETSWTRQGASTMPDWVTTKEAVGEEAAATRAVAGAASFGVATGDAAHRVVVAFNRAPASTGEQPVTTEWMLRAEVALRRSGLLRETGASVATAEQGGTLVVHVSVAASDAMAPAVVRAVMLAVRPTAISDRELEIAMVPDSELARWHRDPGPIGPVTAIPDGVDSDARWLWAVALLLLGIEARVRRVHARRTAGEGHVTAHAA